MKQDVIDPRVAIGRLRIDLIIEAIAWYAQYKMLCTFSSVSTDTLNFVANKATQLARDVAYGDRYCGGEMPAQFQHKAALRIAYEAGRAEDASPHAYHRKAAYWDGYNASGRRLLPIPPHGCFSPIAWLSGYETVRQMHREEEWAAQAAGLPAPPRMPNETEWREICARAVGEAGHCCGSTYEHYVNLLSSEIDKALLAVPEEDREAAIQIAREWDYATREEREQNQQWNAEHGFCSHGIELGCCPAGCGSV